MTEVLTDQKDALIYQVGDIHNLAQKIITLLKNVKLRDRLSKNAVKNPYLNNSWQNVSKKLIDIYRAVLS